MLPNVARPQPIQVPVSQAVNSNGVDRFTFTISPEDGLDGPFTDYVYLLTIDLIYDEDDEMISSGDLIYMVSFPGKPIDFGYLTPDDPRWEGLLPYQKDRILAVAGEIVDISEVPGVRNERLEDLINLVVET